MLRTIGGMAVVLSAACLLLAGCGRSKEPELTTLRVNYLEYASFAPLVIAQEGGFLAEQGITLEPVTLRSSSHGIPALVRGELDMFVGSVRPGILNSIARGAPIRMVADRGRVPTGDLPMVAAFVRKAVAERGPLDDPETLRGLKVATREGTPTAFFLHRLLARSGLDESDIEINDVPIPARADALRRGLVDAVTAPAPLYGQLAEADFAVFWGSDAQVMPGFQYSYLAFGPRLLERDVELGQRFIDGFLAAARQYSEGKTERNLDILTRCMPFDRGTLMSVGWTEIRPDGRMNLDDVREYQEWAVAQGFLDRVLESAEYWDPRFVEAAAGEGG